MQVSVESCGPIERKLTVSVPRAEVDSAIEKRLREVGRNARVPGFRPGRAPHNIIAKRYGGQVTNEVVSDAINASYREALGQEGIKPAGLLSLEPKPFVAGDDLQYVATVELFPEIPKPTLAGRTVEKAVCAVTDADVERALENWRTYHAEFVARGPGERAQDGDRLTIDSDLIADGKKLDYEPVRGQQFVLGNKRLLAAVDDGLRGAAAGENRRIPVTLPADHPLAKAAGKAVEFDVTVKTVERPVLPDLDDAFAEKSGIAGGAANMRAAFKRDLEEEAAKHAESLLRKRVFDALLAANPIAAPQTMVEDEIDYRLRLLSDARDARDGPPPDAGAREKFRPGAVRRITLGLIARAVIDNEGLAPGAEAVKNRIIDMAAGEADDEKVKAFVDWHYADPARLRSVESEVLEDMVVARMLETATVVEKPLSFAELTQAASAPA